MSAPSYLTRWLTNFMSLVEDEETYLTGSHLKVLRLLARHYGAMEEVEFPPYRVDIYLPDYHAAVEVDGPRHSPKQDGVRDSYLLHLYRLPVLRVTADEKSIRVLEMVAEFVNEVEVTKDERWEFAEDRVPWI